LLVLLVVIVGNGFILRAYTVLHLPLDKIENVDVIAITQEDLIAARDLLPAVIKDPVVASKLNPMQNRGSHRLPAYFIPIDYLMQGMIADTGYSLPWTPLADRGLRVLHIPKSQTEYC